MTGREMKTKAIFAALAAQTLLFVACQRDAQTPPPAVEVAAQEQAAPSYPKPVSVEIKPTPMQTLVVKEVKGTAETYGTQLKPGMEVIWGSTVEVAEDAVVSMVAGDQMAVRLWGPGQFRIARKEGGNWVEAIRGRLLAVFRPGTAGAVKGTTATAGVRGTAIYAEGLWDEASYFCFCHGIIDFKHDSTGEVRRIESAHHDVHGSALKKGWFDVAMRGHSDADVKAVSKLIGL